MKRCGCLLLALAGVQSVAAAPYAVQLDPARCVAISPGKLAALGPDWSALGTFAQRCPVPGSDGRVALEVDIIRIDRANRVGFFATRPDMAVPMPVLRDPSGAVVGSLPDGFPIDPPGKLRVRFTNWRSGRPLVVQLYQAGESAIAPHPLSPLRWDARAGRYR